MGTLIYVSQTRSLCYGKIDDPKFVAVASTTERRSPVPLKAMSRSMCRVSRGSSSIREANSLCRRRLRGRARGRSWSAVRCASLRPAGSSSRASGFPCASVRMRSRTRGAKVGNRSSMSPLAASVSRGSSSSSGSPAIEKTLLLRPCRSQKPHTATAKAARNEPKDPDARPVEPGHVVDDHD